jgi:hypothetical protein
MCDDDSALAIVGAIGVLGARLNLAVVGEGVETEQLDVLRHLDCVLVQSFLTGRPMTTDQPRAAVLHKPARRTRRPLSSCTHLSGVDMPKAARTHLLEAGLGSFAAMAFLCRLSCSADAMRTFAAIAQRRFVVIG